jgi:hypothetical protein
MADYSYLSMYQKQPDGGNIGGTNPNPYGVSTDMGMAPGPRPRPQPTNWNTFDQSRNPANTWTQRAPTEYAQPTQQARSTSAPSPWSYNVPQPQQYQTQGTQSNTSPWQSGVPTQVGGWNTQPLRDQYSQYLSSMLPTQQLEQNRVQYGQDFNEAQRRWNQQMGWTQQTDQYNMDLSGRQQQMAEWTANQANQQWYDQFGQTQRNDAFSQDLANRQFGQQGQQFDANLRLQYAAQTIENAYNQGRLTNEQRQLALGELAQRQQNEFQYANLAAAQGWNREELAATQQYRAQQEQLTRAQMAQEMAMQAQALEAQRQNAILQATGRNIAPNARWARRS